jgi:hypothetical protein
MGLDWFISDDLAVRMMPEARGNELVWKSGATGGIALSNAFCHYPVGLGMHLINPDFRPTGLDPSSDPEKTVMADAPSAAMHNQCRCWVKGCPCDYVGSTSGVPQITADLTHRPTRQSRPVTDIAEIIGRMTPTAARNRTVHILADMTPHRMPIR